MGRDCRICQLSSHPYKEMTQLTTEPASTSLKQHVLVGVLSVAHRRRNPALGLVGGNRQRCAHTSVVEQTHLRCMLCSSTCMALSFDQHSWSISPLLFFFFFWHSPSINVWQKRFLPATKNRGGQKPNKNFARRSSLDMHGEIAESLERCWAWPSAEKRAAQKYSTVQYSTVFYKAK